MKLKCFRLNLLRHARYMIQGIHDPHVEMLLKVKIKHGGWTKHASFSIEFKEECWRNEFIEEYWRSEVAACRDGRCEWRSLMMQVLQWKLKVMQHCSEIEVMKTKLKWRRQRWSYEALKLTWWNLEVYIVQQRSELKLKFAKQRSWRWIEVDDTDSDTNDWASKF